MVLWALVGLFSLIFFVEQDISVVHASKTTWTKYKVTLTREFAVNCYNLDERKTCGGYFEPYFELSRGP